MALTSIWRHLLRPLSQHTRICWNLLTFSVRAVMITLRGLNFLGMINGIGMIRERIHKTHKPIIRQGVSNKWLCTLWVLLALFG